MERGADLELKQFLEELLCTRQGRREAIDTPAQKADSWVANRALDDAGDVRRTVCGTARADELTKLEWWRNLVLQLQRYFDNIRNYTK